MKTYIAIICVLVLITFAARAPATPDMHEVTQ